VTKTYLPLSFFVVAFCFFVGSLLDITAPCFLPSPRIVVATAEHDFGTVATGADCVHEFVVKNSGTRPLVISAVSAGCGGCVDVAAYPTESILPGKTAAIQTVLKTSRLQGKVRKHILVESNDPKNGKIVLVLLAVVVEPPNTTE
jgi:hypothetical protein